jgi:hypothetical protein
MVDSEFNEFGVPELGSGDLTLDGIPSPADDYWGGIDTFALSFDGYAYCGSAERCGEIANATKEKYRQTRVLPEALDDLRACLFFEQRRWRHMGQMPDQVSLQYIRALVRAIRASVAAKPGSNS